MKVIHPARHALALACLCLGAALLPGCGKRDPVLARVGKLAITRSEFDSKLRDVASEYQNYVLTPNGRRQFLDVLVREKLILSAASGSGLQRSSEFKSQLEKLKAEAAERLAEGRDYLLTQTWLEDLRKKGILAVTDEELRAYDPRLPEEVELRHILLATPEEAEAVLRRLRQGGGFAALAQSKSLDAETASAGGRMHPALYGEVLPELEDVAFRARAGETVGPVRSKFGYHLIRKETERRVPFERAEQRMRRILEKQKLDRHLQSLQSRYPVEVLDAQFN